MSERNGRPYSQPIRTTLRDKNLCLHTYRRYVRDVSRMSRGGFAARGILRHRFVELHGANVIGPNRRDSSTLGLHRRNNSIVGRIEKRGIGFACSDQTNRAAVGASVGGGRGKGTHVINTNRRTVPLGLGRNVLGFDG